MARYQPLWQQASPAGGWPASLDRQLLAALWPAGGYAVGGLAPTAVNNTMNITIPPSVIAVPLLGSLGTALCMWDANEIVTMPNAPGAGLSRVDRLICQVRDNQIDGGANQDFIFTTVSGAAVASNPVAPATPANAYALLDIVQTGAAANLNGVQIKLRALSTLAVPGGPSFRAFRNGALNTPAAPVSGPFPLDGISWDNAGLAINVGTGAVGFQAATRGFYSIRGQWQMGNPTIGNLFLAYILKNGGIQTENRQGAGTAQPLTLSVNDTLPLAPGDYVQLGWYAQTVNAPVNIGSPQCFLAVDKVSS